MNGGGSGKPKSFADVVKASKAKDPAPSKVAAPAKVPTPAVLPVAAVKPPPVAVASGVASCPSPSPQERGYPLGFKDKAEFDDCMGELDTALAEEGIDASAVGVRGSSVTFKSNNPNKKGSYFDKRGKGKSDIDVFIVTKDYLKVKPSKKGIFYDKDMAAAYPKIDAWNKKWSGKLDPKRKVAVAGFRPAAAMKPTGADSIVHSGSL
jgi:hypothetical protein